MADMRLEVIIIPVADVDRAKEFYDRAGFKLDVDHSGGDNFRVVQYTPPGSSCSIIFGVGLGAVTDSPVKGMHLVVSDVEKAVGELNERGVETTPIYHMNLEGRFDGVDPSHTDYGSYSGFTDPDGNVWVLQEVGYATD